MTTTREHMFYTAITSDVTRASSLAVEGDSLGELVQLQAMAWTVERITRDVVDVARKDGQSWAQIGDALGITRQAAQQKYGPKR